MKILFLTKTSELGAASRFRVYQFLPYLRSQGIDFDVRAATSNEQYLSFVSKQSILGKVRWFGATVINRLQAARWAGRYDVVVVQKESLPFLFPAPELLLRRVAKKIVFDFDDAIFYYRHPLPPIMRLVIDRHSVERILKAVDRVIVSSSFLAKYATRFNSDVRVIPTCIDMTQYRNSDGNRGNLPICIGWIGSHATVGYLRTLQNVLSWLAGRYDFELKIVGGGNVTIKNVCVKTKDWNLESEVEDVCSFDIGVMPLTDDPWTRGKAGLKLLQYMAAGVPAVASAVGVNCEIVQDGINGYLASDDDEWRKKLGVLLTRKDLRDKIGSEGVKTVTSRYSVESNLPAWLEAIGSW